MRQRSLECDKALKERVKKCHMLRQTTLKKQSKKSAIKRGTGKPNIQTKKTTVAKKGKEETKKYKSLRRKQKSKELSKA